MLKYLICVREAVLFVFNNAVIEQIIEKYHLGSIGKQYLKIETIFLVIPKVEKLPA